MLTLQSPCDLAGHPAPVPMAIHLMSCRGPQPRHAVSPTPMRRYQPVSIPHDRRPEQAAPEPVEHRRSNQLQRGSDKPGATEPPRAEQRSGTVS